MCGWAPVGAQGRFYHSWLSHPHPLMEIFGLEFHIFLVLQVIIVIPGTDMH